MAPTLAWSLLREMSTPRTSPLDELTAREREVLELVAEGLSNQEIGDRMSLAEKTIKHYMTNILGKLQVRSRVEAALLAYREGLGNPPDGVTLGAPRRRTMGPWCVQAPWPRLPVMTSPTGWGREPRGGRAGRTPAP